MIVSFLMSAISSNFFLAPNRKFTHTVLNYFTPVHKIKGTHLRRELRAISNFLLRTLSFMPFIPLFSTLFKSVLCVPFLLTGIKFRVKPFEPLSAKLDPPIPSAKLAKLSFPDRMLLNVIFHSFGFFSNSLPSPTNSSAPRVSSSYFFLPSHRLHPIPLLPQFLSCSRTLCCSTISSASWYIYDLPDVVPFYLASPVTPVSLLDPLWSSWLATISSLVIQSALDQHSTFWAFGHLND